MHIDPLIIQIDARLRRYHKNTEPLTKNQPTKEGVKESLGNHAKSLESDRMLEAKNEALPLRNPTVQESPKTMVGEGRGARASKYDEKEHRRRIVALRRAGKMEISISVPSKKFENPRLDPALAGVHFSF